MIHISRKYHVMFPVYQPAVMNEQKNDLLYLSQPTMRGLHLGWGRLSAATSNPSAPQEVAEMGEDTSKEAKQDTQESADLLGKHEAVWRDASFGGWMEYK